jgi:threonine dehydrogenase-like Zn-dependent dehydrogenase
MKAVQLPGDKQVHVVTRPDPSPGQGEVVVRTRASFICRSDMSLYYGNPIVGGEQSGEIIPGHEPAGEVVELGAGVRGVALGDRVAVHLAIGCGHCEYCLAGNRMLCPSWKCLGFDVDGGDADYLVVPAVNCLQIPDALSYEAGALLTDMVGTQYHAQKRLGVSGADTLAIFGLGPMGLAGVLVGRGRGARVIAVDVLDDRLELARSLGADEVVNSGTTDPVEALRELTGGRGVDVAVDCSGAPAAQNAALDAARKQGAVAFVGESRSTTINPSDQMIRKLLTVIGAWYFPLYEYAEIARFAIERDLPVERLITHRFGLDDAPEAFRLFDERKTEKAVFVWDGPTHNSNSREGSS